MAPGPDPVTSAPDRGHGPRRHQSQCLTDKPFLRAETIAVRPFLRSVPLAVAVVVALLIARWSVLLLADLELYGDEAQYWAWSRDLAFGYYSKPPLLAWIIRLFTELCGDGEACIRGASPALHAATAMVVLLLGTRLYDARTGTWAAIVFATLPAVWYSSLLISTDVPLLLLWAVALLTFWNAFRERSWTWSIVAGVAIGVGLLAKYAMIYVFLGVAVFAWVEPTVRAFLASRQFMTIVALAVLLFLPNLLWNLDHGLVTFSHTADNAHWGSGPLLHPDKALEFLGSQFGVFGPLLFATLLWLLVTSFRLRQRTEPDEAGTRVADRYLLSLSVPVILLVLVQALLSRAHANWAAVAYVGATVLVVAWLLRRGARNVLGLSIALHTAAGVYLYAGALGTPLPGMESLRARLEGWRDIGAQVADRAAGAPYTAIAAFDRMATAELLYYARPRLQPVLRWPTEGVPGDHFQLETPLTPKDGGYVLLVSQWPLTDDIISRFETVETREILRIRGPSGSARTVYLYDAEGFQGL